MRPIFLFVSVGDDGIFSISTDDDHCVYLCQGTHLWSPGEPETGLCYDITYSNQETEGEFKYQIKGLKNYEMSTVDPDIVNGYSFIPQSVNELDDMIRTITADWCLLMANMGHYETIWCQLSFLSRL
jgi:hypothetical protein